MNSKVKTIIKHFKERPEQKNKIAIARVSDLIEKEFDADMLANEFIRINKEVWGNITGSQYIWKKEILMSQFRICPNLLYCAFEDGKIVATASGLFTTENDFIKYKSWLEKTANGFFTTYKPDGDILFGADLSVIREASKKTSDKVVLTCLLLTFSTKA